MGLFGQSENIEIELLDEKADRLAQSVVARNERDPRRLIQKKHYLRR
jgi:hypothetical protein